MRYVQEEEEEKEKWDVGSRRRGDTRRWKVDEGGWWTIETGRYVKHEHIYWALRV